MRMRKKHACVDEGIRMCGCEERGGYVKCENATRGKGGKVISNVWVVSKHKVDGNKKLESVQASGLHDGERWWGCVYGTYGT